MAQIDGYIDQTLDGEELRALLAHAKTCAACGAALGAASAASKLLPALDRETVMPAEGRAAWRCAVRALSREAGPAKRRRSLRAFASIAAALIVLLSGTAYLRSRPDISPMRLPVADRALEAAAPGAAAPDSESMSGSAWIGKSVMTDGADDSAQPEGAQSDADRTSLMVRTATRVLETRAFDEDAANIRDLVSEYGGYIESFGVRADAPGADRVGNYALRIPSKQLTDFLYALDGVGKKVYEYEGAEDISEQYYDAESRLASYRTQLERLNELMTQAQSVEEIISVMGSIADVQYEIDWLTGRLNGYSSRLNDSAVTLTLQEVGAASASAQPYDALGPRMSTGFDASLRWLGAFARDAAVALAYAAPVLAAAIPLAAVAAVVIHITRRKRRARRDK
jgi:hypothetical protein